MSHAPQGIDPLALYTPAEAAGLLRVSVRKVRDLHTAGYLPRAPHTRKFLFLGEALLRLARGQAAKP